MLEPGGILINLGPLFWTPPGVTLELTLNGNFSVIELVGRTRVWVDKIGKCEYTRDQEVMIPYIYGTASCRLLARTRHISPVNTPIEVSDPSLVPANGCGTLFDPFI